MDEGSPMDKKYTDFLSDIEKRINDGCELNDEELRLFFEHLQHIDSIIYSNVRKDTKKDALKLKGILLLDKIKATSKNDHLSYTTNYALKLMDRNVKNYKTLAIYSRVCYENPTNEDAKDYLSFMKYCSSYEDMTNHLINSIYNRPCNSALIVSLMDTEEVEEKIGSDNEETINRVYSKVYNSDNIKVIKKYK